MGETVLAKMAVIVSANTAQLARGLKDGQNQFRAFTSGISKLAGAIGIAFGVQQVASFALEISKLAGEAEGVRAAFDRLPDSERLMIQLKEATAGTVSELDLMKRTVQASNFGIGLESLPQLLEFASIRAQQTGQSVDYLVDSIVTGIGRKSPLILDNLGISAVRLKEQFGGAALEAQGIGDVAKAVGKIASEELKKMGGFSNNASSQFQKLTAEITNLKVALGGSANETGIFGDAVKDLILVIQGFTTFLKSDASNGFAEWAKLIGFIPRHTLKAGGAILEMANDFASLDHAIKDFNEEFKGIPFAGVVNETQKYNEKLAELEKKATLAGKKVIILSDDLGHVVAALKPFNNTVINVPFTGASPEVLTSIDSLTKKLKDLTDQFNAASLSGSIADEKIRVNLAAQIKDTTKQIEEAKKLLKSESDRLVGLEGLRAKLAELNQEFDRTNENDKARLNYISQEIAALSALIAKLESLKKARGDAAISLNSGLVTGQLPTGPLDTEKSQQATDKSIDAYLTKQRQLLAETRSTTTQVGQMWVDLSPMISGAISDMAFAFGQASVGVGSFGDAIIQSLISFAKQFGQILVSMGTAALAAKALIKNPIAAIGAGIALLAIAGAASAALQKSQQGFNNGSSGGSGGQTLSEIRYINRETRVYVEGEFKLSGSTAKAMIANQDRRDSRTKPNG